jgi:hypothetical protein
MSPLSWRYVLVGYFCLAAVAQAKEMYAVKLASVENTVLLTLEIDFFETAPASGTVAKIVRSELQTASSLDSTKDIVVQAYLNNQELAGSRWGEPQTYSHSKHRFLTDDEKLNATSHVVTSESYSVQTKSLPVPGGKKAVSITVVFAKAPDAKQAYAKVTAEVAKFISSNRDPTVGDVMGYVDTGNAADPASWQQVRDPVHGYIGVWYDREAGAIKNWRTHEVLLPVASK